jgi:hypothetical protein
MSEALTGGCHCGAIRYRVTTDKPDAYYCHCRMCQLAFGNIFATYVNVAKNEVEWTSGAPAHFRSSKIARRGFCGNCGTPLTFEFLDSDRMDISVGSLDDPGAVRPTIHIAVESRIAAWHVPDGLPEKRLDEFDNITKKWKQAYGEEVEPGLAAARGVSGAGA